MALTGLQIQKLLPKTNCKECGSNTCLAFAMKLAAKKANLSECPYASEEAKQVLGADSEPPVKKVMVGETALGEEIVLYRHEKTFVHQPILAVNIDDNDPKLKDTLAQIKDYILIRVGETLQVGAVSITQKGDDDAFVKAISLVREVTGLPVVLRAAGLSAIEKAATVLKGSASVIANVKAADADKLMQLAADNGLILSIASENIDGVLSLAGSLKDKEFSNLLLQFPTATLAQSLQIHSVIRRAALKDNVKVAGYPFLSFIETGSLADDTTLAVTQICKYGGVIVLPSFNKAQLATLMTLRLNIYTDPQKPIQVEPKVYPIGEPDRNSPVFVTTNFSLTYFLVSGEIENAGISAWLVIPDSEGFSVLTAWAAGKFSGASIGKFIKESGLEDTIDTRTITLPGYVSQISGELEEALPGWRVLVGPQEAGDLESYIKTVLKA